MTHAKDQDRLRATYADILDGDADAGLAAFVAQLETLYAVSVPHADATVAFAQLRVASKPSVAVGKAPGEIFSSDRRPAQIGTVALVSRWSRFSIGVRRFATVAATLLLFICIAGASVVAFQGMRYRSQQRPIPAGAIGTPVLTGVPMASPTTIRDTLVTTNYYWVFDGEKIDRRPQLSPDGRWAAWIPQRVQDGVAVYRLIVRDLDSGVERDLTPDPGFQYSSLRWSSDSQSLAFVKYHRQEGVTTPSEVWRVDSNGSRAQLLYQSTPTSAEPGALGPDIVLGSWSLDGGEIALGSTIWGTTGRSIGTRVSTDGSGQLFPPPSPAPQQVAPTYPAQTLLSSAPTAVVGEWAHAVVTSTSLDGRRILLIRSTSDAPRSGYWGDGEIHILTLADTGGVP